MLFTFLIQSKGNVAKVQVKVLLDCDVRVLLFNLLNMFFFLVVLILSKGDDYRPHKGQLTFDYMNLSFG